MPSIPNPVSAGPPRFVTGLAWSFIGLAAFSALLAGFQTLLFAYVVPTEVLRAVFADAISLKLLPPATINVLQYLPGIGIVLFILSLLTLVVSIALLKRRNWARIAFAWIMIATAILHLAGLLLPFYFMHDFSAAIDGIPQELRGVATIVTTLFSVMSIVMGIAFAVGFAWIAKCLFSNEIAREFVARKEVRVSS